MTSNELNEILNKTRRTPNISLTPEQVEELIKDLEVLEIFRNSGYYVINNGDDDFRLTFGVHGYDVDDFIEWKTGKKKKTLF